MKRRKRPFYRNILNHCYQRTADGGVLFYCYSDYLLWFTHLCVAVRQCGVQLLSACPMPDHVHLSVASPSREAFSDFMRKYTSSFAREYNRYCHRYGPLFESPFGSAPKVGAKKARSNLIYVGNNPVERQLSLRAENYRWNFLAYYKCAHPFSHRIVLRQVRWVLRQAVTEVRKYHASDLPLSYAQLKRLFRPLTPDECQQLVDMIVSTYNVIDYKAAIAFFNSYEDMLNAMHATTGNEYDLNEVFVGKSDAHYARMAATVMRELQPKDIHDILALPQEDKRKVFRLIRRYCDAPAEQIGKFLHMSMETDKKP